MTASNKPSSISLSLSLISLFFFENKKLKGETNTILPEFITCIQHLSIKYGPFDFAIGHSFGGAAIFNAMRLGCSFRKVVTISSQFNLINIFLDFIKIFQLPNDYVDQMLDFYLNKYKLNFSDYNLPNFIMDINCPVLTIHCMNDKDVDSASADMFKSQLSNSILFKTRGLGHRRILRDQKVINQIISFFES